MRQKRRCPAALIEVMRTTGLWVKRRMDIASTPVWVRRVALERNQDALDLVPGVPVAAW
jgi:hypothetical protein